MKQNKILDKLLAMFFFKGALYEFKIEEVYRFDELKLFSFVNFLQTVDVLEAGLAKVALLHLQNRIRLTRSDINTS